MELPTAGTALPRPVGLRATFQPVARAFSTFSAQFADMLAAETGTSTGLPRGA